MKPLFKSYLKKVCFMLSKKNRAATYTELRSHLLQEFDEIQKTQKDSKVAFQTVMHTKPNPYWLGYKMRRAQQSFLRRNMISLSFVFGFMFFLIVGQYINQRIHKEYFPAAQKILTTAENERQFENDLKFISAHPQKDIFQFSEKKPADKFVYEHLSKLSLPENKKIIESYDRIRFKRSPTEDDVRTVETADLEWIDSLQNYDVVSALSSEDIQKFEDSLDSSVFHKIGLHSALKGNGLTELGQLTLAYTYKLCLKKQCEKGIQNLRHVAKLIFTSSYGGFYAQISAINLMKQESKFAKEFNLKNNTPIDPELLNAYHRISWGWLAIINDMFKKNEFSEKWKTFMSRDLGMCGGVNQFAFGWLMAGSDLIDRRWPLEIDFSSAINKEKIMLDELYKKCDMPIYSKLIHTPYNQTKPLGLHLNIGPPLLPESVQPWINEARLPYFRQLLAFEVMMAFNGSYWGVYEKFPPQVN